MKLQLKYYWSAILDWQRFDCMLNGEELSIYFCRVWAASNSEV